MPLFGLSESSVHKMEAKHDVEGLIKALAYKKDLLVRKLAAESLGKLGDKRAVDALIVALKDQDSDVRSAAAEALAKINVARKVDGIARSVDEMPQSQVLCSGCGKAMPSSLEYCSNCGKKLAVKVAPEESNGIVGGRPDENAQRIDAQARQKPSVSPPEPASNSKQEPEIPYKKGSFIGQEYEVIRELGHGGFGIVYLVYPYESKEFYALKTFRDEYLADAEAREMFRREASVWVELGRHPYIVRAYFVDEVSGRLYIAMEYIAPDEMGLNSLEGYLKRQPPDLAQSLGWAIQFCHGMEYAYSKGIRCHRDIKPANIMISTEKVVKITDFGIAGVLGSTMEGKGIGTPTHMPPEQFTNAAACDERSDTYAFGIVLYQMATGGRLPFLASLPKDGSLEEQERFWNEMYLLHSQAQVPRLDSPLFSIVQRCLEKRPERRYQTFKMLRADLEPLLKRQTGEVMKLPTPDEFKAEEWSNKGFSLDSLGRFDEALKCYDKALEINPQYAKAWLNKGANEAQLGLGRDAAISYRRFIELAPAQYAQAIEAARQRLQELEGS